MIRQDKKNKVANRAFWEINMYEQDEIKYPGEMTFDQVRTQEGINKYYANLFNPKHVNYHNNDSERREAEVNLRLYMATSNRTYEDQMRERKDAIERIDKRSKITTVKREGQTEEEYLAEQEELRRKVLAVK